MNFKLVKTENFNGIACNFYYDTYQMWMSRQQIGQALGYSNPRVAIAKIHDDNKERLDRDSVVTKLETTDGKFYSSYLYNERGVMEICRRSRQPLADKFMDWVWDVIISYRHGKQIPQTKSAVQVFFDQQTEIMQQMQRDNATFHKTMLDGFSVLHSLIKELQEERKELYDKLYTGAGETIVDIPDTITDSTGNSLKENNITEIGPMSEWKNKVFSIIDEILNETDEFKNRRDVLSQTYKYMTNVYGTVWTLDRKEYRQKHCIEEGYVRTLDVCYEKYSDRLVNLLEEKLRYYKKKNEIPDWDFMKIKITNYANHVGNHSKGGTSVYRKIYNKMAADGVKWDEYKDGMSKAQIIRKHDDLYRKFCKTAMEIISEE